MSWDNDPYRNMELQFNSQQGLMVRWMCHNCGADGRWHKTETVQLITMRTEWIKHVAFSHRTKTSDTINWTV